MSMNSDATHENGHNRTREALDRINTALRGLRYGTVTAVVQDGVVVQVERTEKFRLERGRQRDVPESARPNDTAVVRSRPTVPI